MPNILTVYFSMKGQTIGPGMKITWQDKGNTKIVAEFIKDAVGGDLFEIEADRKYSEDHMVLIEEAKKELRAGTRVPVKRYPESLAQYDTIFLGYPNWWYVAPTIINTFLESNDFSGKTVVSFATSGGSGMGRTNEKLRPSCPDAKLLPRKLLNGRITEQELKKWVESLGLTQ